MDGSIDSRQMSMWNAIQDTAIYELVVTFSTLWITLTQQTLNFSPEYADLDLTLFLLFYNSTSIEFLIAIILPFLEMLIWFILEA